MSPPPKFATFMQPKKGTLSPFIVTLNFCYTHQLSNARGCHFIKIWFNGSIRTSFTELYKIEQRLPHRPIRAPILIYYCWAASYRREPHYIGLSKTGSDNTIESNDERTAPDLKYKLVGKKQNSELQLKGGVFIFLLYKAGKFRRRRHWFLLDIPFMN